jgi:hypothetical protein
VISSPLEAVVSPRTEISKCYEGTTLIIRTVLYRERNSGRGEQCLVVQRQWRWNRGGAVLASRLSAKATRPSYQKFSGNGIALAAMCAALHQHRPVAANEGGPYQVCSYQWKRASW